MINDRIMHDTFYRLRMNRQTKPLNFHNSLTTLFSVSSVFYGYGLFRCPACENTFDIARELYDNRKPPNEPSETVCPGCNTKVAYLAKSVKGQIRIAACNPKEEPIRQKVLVLYHEPLAPDPANV